MKTGAPECRTKEICILAPGTVDELVERVFRTLRQALGACILAPDI